MTFIEAIKTCFIKKFNKKEGRARRSEFWYFQLFNLLVGLALGVILVALDVPDNISESFARLVNLVFLVPGFHVAVRRLHDTNHSGWWYLINITIIGIPYFLYLAAKEGDRGENQYGPDPKGNLNDDDISENERKLEIEEMGGDTVI